MTRDDPHPDHSRNTHGVLFGLSLCVILLFARLCLLVKLFGVNVLFSDQWDLLGTLFHPESPWQQWSHQHGPHRMGAGLLLMVALMDLSAWNVNVLSYATAVVFALSAVVALYLKHRLTGRLSWTDCWIPCLFLNSSQLEPLLVTPDLSHGPLPALFILLFCLALTMHDGWAKTTALLASLFGAVFDGFGVFLGVIAPVYVLVQLWCSGRDGKTVHALGLAGALVTLALFFHGYRFLPADCRIVPDHEPWRYLRFIVYSYARAYGGTRALSISTAMGLMSCVAVFALAIRLGRQLLAKPRRVGAFDWVIFTLVSFGVLFSVTATIGRACLEPDAGFVTRYVPYTVLGIYAVYLYLEGASGAKARLLKYVMVVTFIALDLWPRSIDVSTARAYRDKKLAWVACYVKTKDVHHCRTEVGFDVYPFRDDPQFLEKIEYLESHRLGFFAP